MRIGIVPTRQVANDLVRIDEDKNLVICPLKHDQDFMQIFYEGWRVVRAFMAAQAPVPKEAALPSPVEREVARILYQRREYPVLEVIEAIEPFGQPHLLHTDERQLQLLSLSGGEPPRRKWSSPPYPEC